MRALCIREDKVVSERYAKTILPHQLGPSETIDDGSYKDVHVGMVLIDDQWQSPNIEENKTELETLREQVELLGKELVKEKLRQGGV